MSDKESDGVFSPQGKMISMLLVKKYWIFFGIHVGNASGIGWLMQEYLAQTA